MAFLYSYSSHIFTSYPRDIHVKKILDPRNTHERKFDTHEIPTRKNFGTLKYPREKSSNPQKNFGLTKARWHYTHETHDRTRPTECSTLGCNPLRSPFFLVHHNPYLRCGDKGTRISTWRPFLNYREKDSRYFKTLTLLQHPLSTNTPNLCLLTQSSELDSSWNTGSFFLSFRISNQIPCVYACVCVSMSLCVFVVHPLLCPRDRVG